MSPFRALTFLLCVAGTTIPAMAIHAAPPTRITATYDVYKDGVQAGVAHEIYESDGKRYRVTSETAPIGLAAVFMRGHITVTSEGAVTPQGLKPARMTYGRSDKPDKDISAVFDWDAGLLRLHFDGRDETASLEAGTQDRLSVMYEFLFLSAQKVRTLSFAMTNGRKVQRYDYRLEDTPPLDTPLGRYATLHLVKQDNADSDNRVQIWLARSRRLFPVKLVIVENGSRIEQVLTALEIK